MPNSCLARLGSEVLFARSLEVVNSVLVEWTKREAGLANEQQRDESNKISLEGKKGPEEYKISMPWKSTLASRSFDTG